MLYHYVNLVSWKFFEDSVLKDASDQFIYIDSLSLFVVSRFFGFRIKKYSGVLALSDLLEIIDFQSCIILGGDSRFLEIKNVEVPYWTNPNEICLHEDFVKELSCYQTIFIGISSPKQDKLGLLIQEVMPEKDIYCFGAALYAKPFRILGTYWLSFLFKSPGRSVVKLSQTFLNILELLLNFSRRNQLRNLLSHIEQNNPK